jgi:SdpI/YfhL protein family
MKHKIPPNHWYGFRVPATLNDPGLWYKVNAYAASGLLWGRNHDAHLCGSTIRLSWSEYPNLSVCVHRYSRYWGLRESGKDLSLSSQALALARSTKIFLNKEEPL